ncbi:exocyst complex protein Exo70, Cullin repeat-like-containing domain protein [Artemisia annua]|uniref:Exocyst subunit Exo70 family protein n=1 Tax=Artemisia annua TaxID=35608 RepID=A0A2U1LH39_ARTAN|nr:exocyst complex protein Exo70, Cullin repeat-like-containing domain protein [Artemisia annua]
MNATNIGVMEQEQRKIETKTQIRGAVSERRQERLAKTRQKQELGKTVFSDHIFVFTGLFVKLIRGTLMPLLEFPKKVGTIKPKAKRLSKFLDIYESLCDLYIVADESGPTIVNLEEYGHMKAEIKSVKAGIGNSIVDMFNDLKNSIQNDGSRNPVQGGYTR